MSIFSGSEDNFDPGINQAKLEPQESVLERLKRDNEVTRETFWDRMKFWEATRPRPEDIEEQIKVFCIITKYYFEESKT